MKLKLSPRAVWQLPLLLIFLICCTELELKEQEQQTVQDLISSRAHLPKELLDSTLRAEKFIKDNNGKVPDVPNNGNNGGNQVSIAAAAATLVNYAPQATVSAQSTYPGYSVLKIKDGSRNTTVGPSYSWANNHPAGGTLPESVFLKFGTLKNIERIDIYTSSGYALQNYTIQFRATPTASWITLVTVVGNTLVSRSHTFATVNLLEVQIICQRGPANQTIYGRLNEVELYGSAEPTLPYILNQNGILALNSISDVDQAIAYLEYKYDQYSDAFAAQYPSLTADQFADVEEAMGFNDDQPFIDFENQYGIYSLRASLAAQENNWLATTAGDETAGQDPDDLYMDDYEVRTLVNSDGYIKVGTFYYVFLSDDSYYTYDGGGGCIDCLIQLSAIKKLKPGDPMPPGVKHFKPAPIVSLAYPGCRSDATSRDFRKNSDGTWRFKWKVKVFDGPFPAPGRVKAITKSYKKKNGRWKVTGAKVSAQVYGDVVGQDCTGGAAVDSGAGLYKHRRRITAKVPLSFLAVKKDQIHGIHNHEKVPGYISTLTW